MGCSLISSNLIPPSFLPAKVRGDGRLPGPPTEGEEPNVLLTLEGVDPVRDNGEEAKPPTECRLGMPFNGVVSVILRGIPRDRKGTVGAGFFLMLF